MTVPKTRLAQTDTQRWGRMTWTHRGRSCASHMRSLIRTRTWWLTWLTVRNSCSKTEESSSISNKNNRWLTRWWKRLSLEAVRIVEARCPRSAKSFGIRLTDKCWLKMSLRHESWKRWPSKLPKSGWASLKSSFSRLMKRQHRLSLNSLKGHKTASYSRSTPTTCITSRRLWASPSADSTFIRSRWPSARAQTVCLSTVRSACI